MCEQLLSVGLGAHHGTYHEPSVNQVTSSLVAGTLRGINYRQASVRAAILFATADWCVPSPVTIAGLIRAELKKTVGYEVPLIGGSMAGMYCSTISEPRIQHGLSLAALCSDQLWVTVDGLPGKDLDWESESRRRQRLRDFAQELQAAAGIRQGVNAERYLFGILPGLRHDANGLRSYRDGELHKEVLAAFNHHYRLVGGSAADGLHPERGFQFVNDQCYESGLALALVETDLCSGSVITHGFTSQQHPRVRIDALADGGNHGYDVEQINGKPAAQAMRELAELNPGMSIGPILGTSDDPGCRVLFPIRQVQAVGQIVRLSRRVSRGDSLYLLAASPDQMLRAGEVGVRCAVERATSIPAEAALLLAFSCTARATAYRDQGIHWENVANRIRGEYPGVPILVALSAGEFGVDESRQSRANNMSVTVCCLATTRNARSQGRRLQADLLEAESRLATCLTSKEVMKAALDGVICAGAEGGQICLVDYALGRIVGPHFGYAARGSGSIQDWDAVLAKTDRCIPIDVTGAVPDELRDFSIRAAMLPSLSRSYSPQEVNEATKQEEDILTLITRSLHAVCVENVEDRRFHCDVEAARLGHVRTFLAIPLVGQRGKAIATLQVGLPDLTKLDRERFAIWVRYGQAVASVLERALSAEQARIETEMLAVCEQIIHAPTDIRASPYAWCDRYLARIIELLGVDDGHMRVLHIRGKGKREFRLVGGVGRLAEVRRQTRPITHDNDGSFNLDRLRQGGMFSNTATETRGFNQHVKPLGGTREFGEAFERERDLVHSFMILPLKIDEDVFGSFVLDSLHDYAFGERTQHLARTAARHASVLLGNRNAMYDRALAQHGAARMLSILGQPCEKGSRGRLRQLLAHVCDLIGADVGSLYVLHPEQRKLVLYSAHNWFESNMEGKVHYDLGQGWTGSLPLSDAIVTVVRPEDRPVNCTQFCYAKMVPPEHRLVPSDDARIGIKLVYENKPIAVATFAYYRSHAGRLIADDRRYREFLTAAGNILAIAIEHALHDDRLQEHDRLQNMYQGIVSMLEVCRPRGNWQDVLDALCSGFCVTRVIYYEIGSGCSFRPAFASVSKDIAEPTSTEPSVPVGVLRDAANQDEPVSIEKADDPRLAVLRSHEDTRALFVVRIPRAAAGVHGVLVLTDRRCEVAHPFPFLDEIESRTAYHLARAMGLALDGLYVTDALQKRVERSVRTAVAGLFSTIVMHDLKAPLGRIIRAVGWLRDFPSKLGDERERRLTRIEHNVNQVGERIGYAAQRGLPGPSNERLSRVVREALRLAEPGVSSPRVQIRRSFLPDALVRVDLYAIVAALVGLIENALEAMGEDGVLTIQSSVVTDGQTQWAVLGIHNTGPELTEEQIRRLSAPGNTTKDGHLGMGIAIAKQVIEAAGGSLRIESPSHGGVEVTIRLPVVAPDVKAPLRTDDEEKTDHED